MKSHLLTALLALGTLTFAGKATADLQRPPEERMHFSLKPGETRLIYVAGPSADSVLPVFKICLNSSPADVVLVEFDKSPSSLDPSQTEALPERSCLFASSRRLEVTAVKSKAETDEDSADWLTQEIEELQAKKTRTDEEEGQLRRYKMNLRRMEFHLVVSLIPY